MWQTLQRSNWDFQLNPKYRLSCLPLDDIDLPWTNRKRVWWVSLRSLCERGSRHWDLLEVIDLRGCTFHAYRTLAFGADVLRTDDEEPCADTEAREPHEDELRSQEVKVRCRRMWRWLVVDDGVFFFLGWWFKSASKRLMKESIPQLFKRLIALCFLNPKPM